MSIGQWQTTTGDKILMSTETSGQFGHLLQDSQKSLWSLILYTFFHDFIHVYSPGTGVDNPLGTILLCQQEHLVTSVIFCKCQKKSLWRLILNIFFSWFYTCIWPRSRGRQLQEAKFWCQQKRLVTSFICCKFQNKSLQSAILYNCFIYLIRDIAPGQGQTASTGQSFDVRLVTSFICYKFQNNVFEVWFYTFFSWFNTASGQGQTAPRGQHFDANRKALTLYPFLASFKRISLKSALYLFFMILYMYIAPGQGTGNPQGTKFWCQQKLLVASVICC